ncbi:MAG: tryptophan synthase subunit alpha [Methanosphaera sp.]|nr:tryptophan synthase subunit alpha [Methanosphaera sp.]
MTKVCYAEMFERLEKNDEGAFIPFVVAGDPDYDTSLEIVKRLVDSGVDALEIGFPFSDPVADGASVQEADIRAFEGGMTIEKCFSFLEEVRKYTMIPIGLLLYYNIVYKHGIDAFYKRLNDLDINAVLIADLPPEEAEDVIDASDKYGVEEIFIVSQSTSNERLNRISEIVGGFIYVASVMGTTGVRKEVEHNTKELVKRIKKNTDIPICVGFGISQEKHVKEVLEAGSDGAIVGSAIINIIKENLDDKNKLYEEITDYTRRMKNATRR